MKVVLICSLLLLQAQAMASTDFKCPLKKDRQAFTSLGIYDGNPKDKAALKPDNGDADFPHYWNLSTTEPWLVCQYGAEQKILVEKKLKGKFAHCLTKEEKSGSGQFNMISCTAPTE